MPDKLFRCIDEACERLLVEPLLVAVGVYVATQSALLTQNAELSNKPLDVTDVAPDITRQ